MKIDPDMEEEEEDRLYEAYFSEKALSLGHLNKTLDFLHNIDPTEYYKFLAEETSAATYIQDMFCEDDYKEAENILDRIENRIDSVQKSIVKKEIKEVVGE